MWLHMHIKRFTCQTSLFSGHDLRWAPGVVSFWRKRCFFSSPGSQGELSVYQQSAVYPSSTLSNSEASFCDQILYEASMGWGKDCIRFWDRLDQNSGFHGNRKRPLTYKTMSPPLLFLIRSFSNMQEKRTCIKSRMSSNFRQIRPLPTELGALGRLKLIMGKWCLQVARSRFIGTLSNLLVTRTGIKSWPSSNSGRIKSVFSVLRTLEGGLNFQ